jgi:hypothetical protein
MASLIASHLSYWNKTFREKKSQDEVAERLF